MNPRIVVLVVLTIVLAILLHRQVDRDPPAADGDAAAARGVEEGATGRVEERATSSDDRIAWASWRKGSGGRPPDEVRGEPGDPVDEAPSAARQKLERDLAGVDVVLGGRTAPPRETGSEDVHERRRTGN